jgi:hypothetical protein
MMRIVLLIGSAVLMGAACSVGPGPVPDVLPPALAGMNSETDGAVLQTVLDDMIRPEASRLGHVPVSVIAYDRTVPICSIKLPEYRFGCIRTWNLQTLGNPALRPGVLMFEGLVTPTQRAQLVGAFWKRNEASHPLPVGAINGATMVAPGDRESEPTGFDFARGIVSFSAPAYGGGGLALVYADYRCGQLCGYGWFVLLERQTGVWHIKGHRGLWVS